MVVHVGETEMELLVVTVQRVRKNKFCIHAAVNLNTFGHTSCNSEDYGETCKHKTVEHKYVPFQNHCYWFKVGYSVVPICMYLKYIQL